MDSTIYELLVTDDFKRFTTLDLRDAYAKTLGSGFDLIQLRIYCYEQIVRLEKANWLVREGERFKHGQVFWREGKPDNITVRFVENGFIQWLEKRQSASSQPGELRDTGREDSGSRSELMQILEEIEVSLVKSKSEIDCYQSLMTKIPAIDSLIAPQSQQAHDHYLQLLGQQKALKKTLELLDLKNSASLS